MLSPTSFLQVEQVKLLDRFSTSNKSLTGTLYLTATHLLFIDSSRRETWVSISNACGSKSVGSSDAFVLPDLRLNLFAKMFNVKVIPRDLLVCDIIS